MGSNPSAPTREPKLSAISFQLLNNNFRFIYGYSSNPCDPWRFLPLLLLLV